MATLHAQQSTQETEQFGGIQRYRPQDEDGFNAFAQHHQEDKQKQAEGSVLSGQRTDLALNLAFERPAGFHHEDDHGDDEEGRCQHDPAFEDVLVPLSAGEQDGDADTP